MKWFPTSVVLSASLVAGYAMAEAPSFAHLSTTGYGEVVAKPDMAIFTVKVVDSTMTAESAKQSVDTTVDAFLAALTKAGVDKQQITSTNLYLAPQYHYPKNEKPYLVGYRASRSVTVKVANLANLNAYLDLALNAGINQVDNIQLLVSNEAEYQQQARLEAIKDAQQKAGFLAKGFGKSLGEVWQINYNQPNVQPVLMRTMMMDAKSESNSYQDSSLIIRDQVDVTYKLN
ncbi:TPA: oxidative stress defense protein [Vibrio vulnificus]|nr:oxidative stress defense protein [Vibrio vulnificus]